MTAPTRQLRRCALVPFLVLGALAGAALAQGPGAASPGALGQQTQRAMQSAMDDLFNQGLTAPTAESLEEKVGKEKVDAFLANAVVKLTLMPDGAYRALALEGGEVMSFKLGGKKFTPPDDEAYDAGWLIREGAFETPKKAQKLSLELKAGQRPVTVECHNKYGKSDEPVTYYVGPLDGLFCVGFTEAEPDDEAEGDEVG